MDKETARRQFVNELWQRYEQLQRWAEENWPDKEHPLSSADFVETRKELLGLRNPAQAPGQRSPGEAQGDAREPEQGGAQYIDVNPTPWP
ncbi:hypothetical protein [Duganella violaceipulchra]|uniref:Uncharacterized protein n=1 Tax=Duganella violaceipulchra TaxID=2849652 RepID=A0AA41L252_9BURK|nr:hypothetical protein [Duganella violaceicalia]MBV6319764.1 hypothetical protein [Duganella violaceicalia]MCP2006421.1 hypothetical protein [Duganella violaceicalia]